jgi:DNA repair exonuclease SbcCD ATPase subunit
MRLLSLETIGCKRFLLNNINRILYTPTEQLQVILGSNGCGKSSFLRANTPLPPSAADYSKEGKVAVQYEHRGNIYTMTSVFSPSQRHTFQINDGPDINEGGTASVQRDLVKKYFNITPDIHELLIGGTRFHSMGPGERRQWFTRLSDTNYTFAISTYQKLKENHRDIVGTIKLNQARSVQEANKLLTPEQEANLRKEIEELTTLVNNLLLSRSSKVIYSADVKNQLQTTQTTIVKASKELLQKRAQFLNFENIASIEEIDQQLIDTIAKVNSLTQQLAQIATQIEEQQNLQKALSNTNLTNFNDIDGKISELCVQIDAKRHMITSNLQFTTAPQQAYQAIETLQPSLNDIFTQLEPNEDRRYSRDGYAAIVQQIQFFESQLKEQKNNHDKWISQKNQQEQLKTEHEIECPNCQHKWIKGYDPHLYQNILSKLAHTQEKIQEADAKLLMYRDLLQKAETWNTLARAYTSITLSWSVLEPLWKDISQRELAITSPSSVINFIQQIKFELTVWMEIEHLTKETTELEKLKQLLRSDEQTNLNKINDSLDILSLSYSETTEMLRSTKAKVTQLKHYKDTALSVSKMQIDLEKLVEKQEELGADLVTAMRKDAVNQMIQIVQLELSRKEQQLSQINVQKALVESIQNQIKELDAKQIVLKMMVSELSPTDGLIAKGLLGFINNFVGQMNNFIRKVWLYPLEILPCKVDENNDVDLDFKFMVNVNDGAVSPDVAKTSSAQREIINLSFLIVSMKYLDLEDGYLVLDEFAASFDPAHRSSAMRAITETIAASNFSQIFIVSHYREGFGSLANAEICVLCDNNIMLPKDCVYNRHVSIS